MDCRNREAGKRNRGKGDYITVSLKLRPDVLQALENAVSETIDKNMSRYIEETVSKKIRRRPVKLKDVLRQKYKTYPIKKTFTFSPAFVIELKNQNASMSFFVGEVLSRSFGL